jgi:hypothetical protein
MEKLSYLSISINIILNINLTFNWKLLITSLNLISIQFLSYLFREEREMKFKVSPQRFEIIESCF